MTQAKKFELVSFMLCPYVQRSVITLKYKKAPFDITYIDLFNPPSWFEEISPLGQVPLLKVDGTVLFESAVINEYLDEVVGPQMHPRDPLRKALERAWVEFGAELLRQNYMLFKETDRKAIEEMKNELFSDLERLEKAVSSGPFFRGKEFGLVDAAIAPFFMRLFLADEFNPDSKTADPRWKKLPKVAAWAKALLAEPAVRESVGPEFGEMYRDYCRKNGSALFKA